MKKKLCMLFCIFLLVVSCTEFQDTIDIHPKVHLVGDIIGLEYSIYNWNILDEIRGASPQMVQYFSDHKEDLNLRLHIYLNTAKNHTTYFTYYIGGVKICTNYDILSSNDIKRVIREEMNKQIEENIQPEDTPSSPSNTPTEKNEKESL